MNTHKTFWGSVIISGLWSAFIIYVEMFRYSNQNFLMALAGLAVTFFITYQIVRVLQYIPDRLEKQEPPRRSRRQVDEMLNTLDEDQLDLLRQRLSDLDEREYGSIGDLLVQDEGKRKIR